ncbi:hypothetical protein QMP26_05630 [Enterocloster clostridioformis]|nr:hypothetical protein [uncultured Anaerostipes sp.]
MYKKRFYFTICFVLLTILLVYIQNFAQVQDKGEVIEIDKHYKITAHVDDKSKQTYIYHYLIYNSSGKMVKEDDHYGTPPVIKYIDKNTLQISLSAGTATFFCSYYDIINDRFSKQYFSPLETGYGRIVYQERSGDFKLIVSDIFDEDIYYEEFLLEDVSDVLSPILEIEFVNKHALHVKYQSGESLEEKSVLLTLP